MNSILLTSRSAANHNLTLSNSFKSTKHHSDGSSDDSSILDSSLNSIAGQSNEAASAAGLHGVGTSNQFISDKLCLIIYELNSIRPALLELVLPQLEWKLKSNEVKERREYTRLLSKMFSEKESTLALQVPSLWETYLERFADMNEDIRKICIQHIGDFLIQQSNVFSQLSANTSLGSHQTNSHLLHHPLTSSNSSQLLEQIIEQVKNRSLDPDEGLRYEVLQEILKAVKMDTNLLTSELLNILKERTLDIKVLTWKNIFILKYLNQNCQNILLKLICLMFKSCLKLIIDKQTLKRLSLNSSQSSKILTLYQIYNCQNRFEYENWRCKDWPLCTRKYTANQAAEKMCSFSIGYRPQ